MRRILGWLAISAAICFIVGCGGSDEATPIKQAPITGMQCGTFGVLVDNTAQTIILERFDPNGQNYDVSYVYPAGSGFAADSRPPSITAWVEGGNRAEISNMVWNDAGEPVSFNVNVNGEAICSWSAGG